ncbi:MAG: T9SS type A sorting domain-containing protein [Bacteroidia bacterium]
MKKALTIAAMILMSVIVTAQTHSWELASKVDSAIALFGVKVQSDYAYTCGTLSGEFGSHGVIWRTADNGDTWNRVFVVIDSNANTNMHALDFWKDDMGLCVGNDPYITSSFVGKKAQIWRTTDHGSNWGPLNPIIGGFAEFRTIHDVHTPWPDLPFAYIAADDGIVGLSDNRGDTWAFVKLADTLSAVNAVHFITPEVGLVCNDNGEIYRTNDSGHTWMSVYSSPFFGLNDIHFNGAVGICAGGASNLITSADSGQTWSALSNPDMDFYNTAYVICPEDIRGAGEDGNEVVYSVDTGASFMNYLLPSGSGGEWIHKMDFYESKGMAVGTNGYVIRGNGNECLNTGIDNPATAHNLKLWPNPAENILKISLTDIDIEEVQIYSLEGIRFDFGLQKENSVYQLDIRQLPAGIYLIRINKSIARKFTKIDF